MFVYNAGVVIIRIEDKNLKIMPELPEVETITQDLKNRILGWTIFDVWSDWPKYFKTSGGFSEARRMLVGRKITAVERRGKNIVFYLSSVWVMAVHLKMTGRFLLGRPDKPEYIHLIFDLKKGGRKIKLYFSDVRKFGRVIVGKKEAVMSLPEIGELGPDPFSLMAAGFLNLIARRRGRIKSVLLDQKFLAGVGNIYSDEALYLARIHPLSRVEKIPREKLKLLFQKLIQVLKKSIKLRGTTRRDYRDVAGRKGGYFNQRLVYARGGEKCSCGGVIDTVKVGGRTAHFCPKCQMLY